MIYKSLVRNSVTFYNHSVRRRSSYDQPVKERSLAVWGVVAYLGLAGTLLAYRTVIGTASAILDISPELTDLQKVAQVRMAAIKGAKDGALMFYPLMHLAEFIKDCYKTPKSFLDNSQSLEEQSVSQCDPKV